MEASKSTPKYIIKNHDLEKIQWRDITRRYFRGSK